MKKQNILKKISLIVLSSIMTIPGVLAIPRNTVTHDKNESDPAYPKLTTKDAGKNLTNKKKTSSGTGFVGTAFAIIGVSVAINETHNLTSALFGNPYFKLGMMYQLYREYGDRTCPVRRAMMSPERDLMNILKYFQRQEQRQDIPQNISYNTFHTYENQYEPDNTYVTQTIEMETEKPKMKLALPIFKGIVSKMTDTEIGDLEQKGMGFAEKNPVIAKLLLKRFDVLLIDAFESAAEKISSLFSSTSESEID